MVNQRSVPDSAGMYPLGSRQRHDRPAWSPAAICCPVRVLLVEDQASVAHRLRAVLHGSPDVFVCGTAVTGQGALLATRRLDPDVCLVSAALGPAAALRLTDRIRRLAGAPHVLLYAETVEPVMVAAARLAGADGVVPRDDDPAAVAHIITATVDGGLPPSALAPRSPQRLADLAEDRDRPIVTMLLLGIHPDEIARTLGISSRALRSRRQHILYQLDEALTARAGGRLGAPTRGVWPPGVEAIAWSD
jgi:DNA-binding NarL/FixJ family response regulator